MRARKEDIPVLVWHFIGQLGAPFGRKIERVPKPSAADRELFVKRYPPSLV
jgi:transcriptional regulator with PAS, ATPase and Fis domain